MKLALVMLLAYIPLFIFMYNEYRKELAAQNDPRNSQKKR